MRAVSFGQDQSARKHSLRHGGHRPARFDTRGHLHRRCRGRVAQARHGHRDQCRLGRLPRRPMDLPRRSGLDRVPARRFCSACGVRRGGRGVRTLARTCRGIGATAEVHRGSSHPTRRLRQQDRLSRSPRARHAGGAAVRVDAQAGAAPGSHPPPIAGRQRGDGGLRRSRERARLSLQVERRIRSHRDAGRGPAARIRGPARTPGDALRIRRHVARAADRGRRAGKIPDLSRPPRRVRRRPDRARVAGCR